MLMEMVDGVNWKGMSAKLNVFIENGRWNFPVSLIDIFNRVGYDILAVPCMGEKIGQYGNMI